MQKLISCEIFFTFKDSFICCYIHLVSDKLQSSFNAWWTRLSYILDMSISSVRIVRFIWYINILFRISNMYCKQCRPWSDGQTQYLIWVYTVAEVSMKVMGLFFIPGPVCVCVRLSVRSSYQRWYVDDCGWIPGNIVRNVSIWQYDTENKTRGTIWRMYIYSVLYHLCIWKGFKKTLLSGCHYQKFFRKIESWSETNTIKSNTPP